MEAWELWKKWFATWEGATQRLFESVMKSPLVLEPAAAVLSATARSRAATDRGVAAWWAALGLPTRRDQERTLHALGQLESRLLDLEERLAGGAPGQSGAAAAREGEA